MPQFAAAHPRKERLGAVGAGVVDAVSSWWLTRFIENWRVTNSRPGSHRRERRFLAIRARMNETAASSEANTWGNVRPSRSRITTTTLRFPDWFSASRRSIRSAAKFSGRTWPRNRRRRFRRPFPRRRSSIRATPRPSLRAAYAPERTPFYMNAQIQDKASMLLPFTSLQNTTIDKR